ncbi:MAG: DUF4124 domain-containing protein [Pseudomonadota bacterium]
MKACLLGRAMAGSAAVQALSLALLLSVTGPAAAGEMYRWKDADGKLHFTDTPPPPGAETVKMESRDISVVDTVKPARPASQRQVPISDVVQRELDWQRGVRTPQERRAQQREAAAEDKCARMKRQLDRMDGTTRVDVATTLRYEEAYNEAGCR